MAGDHDDRVAAILAYHEATKHSPESVRRRFHRVDWDNKPHPFKVYAGLERVGLPGDVPSLGVPALEAIGVTAVPEPSPGPDLASLARLLLSGAGVHHTVTFLGNDAIRFRNYASAGALYPVEVHVACADLAGLPAGVYHFDPAGRALTRLREGDHRGLLVHATASEPAVARAPVVLALTGIPWRTAWKYTERGYRHLFWDAGMILANVLALAAAARLPARVVLGFADAEVGALLGLEERREFPLCLVPVGASDAEVPPADVPAGEAGFRVAPLSRTEYVFEGILEANEAGRLDSPEDVRRWREGFAGSGGGLSVEPPVLPADGPADSLEEVVRRRGSARVFVPSRPIPAEVLAATLRLATAGIPTDCAPSGAHLIEPYLIANVVEGLEPGAYVFRDGELRLLRPGNFRPDAGFLCLEQELGAYAAATHFLMANLPRTLGALGARGYRAAQLEAGIVAGRIYLGAYAHRFGATGLTFYDDEVTGSSSPMPRRRAACWWWPSVRAHASAGSDCQTRRVVSTDGSKRTALSTASRRLVQEHRSDRLVSRARKDRPRLSQRRLRLGRHALGYGEQAGESRHVLVGDDAIEDVVGDHRAPKQRVQGGLQRALAVALEDQLDGARAVGAHRLNDFPSHTTRRQASREIAPEATGLGHGWLGRRAEDRVDDARQRLAHGDEAEVGEDVRDLVGIPQGADLRHAVEKPDDALPAHAAGVGPLHDDRTGVASLGERRGRCGGDAKGGPRPLARSDGGHVNQVDPSLGVPGGCTRLLHFHA